MRSRAPVRKARFLGGTMPVTGLDDALWSGLRSRLAPYIELSDCAEADGIIGTTLDVAEVKADWLAEMTDDAVPMTIPMRRTRTADPRSLVIGRDRGTSRLRVWPPDRSCLLRRQNDGIAFSYSDWSPASTWLRRLFQDLLREKALRDGHMIIESSAVAVCGVEGVLIPGIAGAGKTTLAEALLQTFPGSMFVANDEVIIAVGSDEVTLWGTPTHLRIGESRATKDRIDYADYAGRLGAEVAPEARLRLMLVPAPGRGVVRIDPLTALLVLERSSKGYGDWTPLWLGGPSSARSLRALRAEPSRLPPAYAVGWESMAQAVELVKSLC